MECPRCGTKTDSWPCPNCGFPVFRVRTVIKNKTEKIINSINERRNNNANSPNDTINTDEFRRACIACNVDPDSFTQSDFDKLQRKLNQIG